MNLTLEKKVSVVIDTDIERQRITKAFKNDKETRGRLNLLMDLIEGGCWKEALAELDGTWWQGRDERLECPRLEFVGMVKHNSPHFNHWFSYIDLIVVMNEYPDVYKVSKSA